MRALMRRLIARKGGRRPRKGRPERWRRHLPLAVALLGFSAGVAVGAWQLWHGGYVHRATDGIAQWGQRQMVAAGLTVRHVFVTGRGETSKAAVLKAVAVRTGQPILSFDPAAARDRLVAMGWIKSARIERRLPDTIIVHLRERAPLALWQYQGRHLLIDREGA
ncbi:MAG: FtsQ-type POTRA domain-containing protein, partial [Alphaproteobacteria bacterium]|nr:FtsQ-type POTRA domain-containing protein [Alphaproteobacteria bacterium]